jgi:acetyl esterase/lipase
VGEGDVLRDECEAYAHKLMQSGVVIFAIWYFCSNHSFVMLNAIIDNPVTRGTIDQAMNMLKKVFFNQSHHHHFIVEFILFMPAIIMVVQMPNYTIK